MQINKVIIELVDDDNEIKTISFDKIETEGPIARLKEPTLDINKHFALIINNITKSSDEYVSKPYPYEK